MYWVTQDDFKKATGEDYDARNAKHRQLFFDLNSSGESTVAPTAGVGQGPAYDSLEYHTMRRRPANIPARYIDVDGKKVANPQARYDTVDGTIANTTSQSRAKTQWDADDAAALKRIDAEAAKRDAEIRAEARRIVGAEQKAATKNARQSYMDQIGDSLNKDGSRTIVEPIRGDGGADPDIQRGQFPVYPEGQADSYYRKREAPSAGVSNIVNSLISGAGKAVIEKGQDVSRIMKQALMQTQPMQGQPAGGADPDNQPGQHNGEYYFGNPLKYSPPVDRTPTGTMTSDAQRSVTDSAANTLQDMMRSGSDWMKKQSMHSPGVNYPETGANENSI
jgi:hypothetical protein